MRILSGFWTRLRPCLKVPDRKLVVMADTSIYIFQPCTSTRAVTGLKTPEAKPITISLLPNCLSWRRVISVCKVHQTDRETSKCQNFPWRIKLVPNWLIKSSGDIVIPSRHVEKVAKRKLQMKTLWADRGSWQKVHWKSYTKLDPNYSHDTWTMTGGKYQNIVIGKNERWYNEQQAYGLQTNPVRLNCIVRETIVVIKKNLRQP